MEEIFERQIVETVGQWLSRQEEGTIVFASPILMESMEERLLSVYGFIGGIRLSLFAGLIESVTQIRNERRAISREDQCFLLWGTAQNLQDVADQKRNNGIWDNPHVSRVVASMIRELKQAGIQSTAVQSLGLPGEFIGIWDAYERVLETLGLSDYENAYTEACRMIERYGPPSYLQNSLWVGFQEFTAQQNQFLAALKNTKMQRVHSSPDQSDLQDDDAVIRGLSAEIRSFSGNDREREVRLIAEEIKRLLQTGCSSRSIGVVFSELSQYLSIIKRIFADERIPWNEPVAIHWIQLPPLNSLLLWLRLVSQEFQPSRSEMFFLFNQYFTGELGLTVDQWIADDPDIRRRNPTLKQWAQWLRTKAETAGPPLAMAAIFLADRLDGFEESKPLSEVWAIGRDWFSHWTDEADDYFSLDSSGTSMEVRRVLMKKARVELLETWNRWEGWCEMLGWSNRHVTAIDFAGLLEDLLARAETSENFGNAYAVTVAAPAQIKNSRFETLFVGGMMEGEFPRKPARSFLISDEVLKNMSRAGLALKSSETFLEHEWQSFSQLLQSADRRIYLTYARVGNDGKPFSPSPFLLRIQSILSKDDRPEDPPECLGSIQNLSKGPKSFQSPSRVTSEIYQAIQSEHRRRSGVSEFVGRIGTVPSVARRLREDFSPRYPFSPSALKEYATCPFGFFCHRVLRVQPVEEPTPLPTPAELGTLSHEALRIFFENHREERLIHEKINDYIEEIMAIVGRLSDRGEEPSEGENDPYILQRLQLANLKESLRHFMIDEITWQERIGWSYLPFDFEKTFGADGDSIQLMIGPEPDGQVRLLGKIDRIDRSRDGQTFVIFDYKTGGVPKASEIAEGIDLQLPIYLKAAERLMAPSRAVGAGYCSLKRRERTSGVWKTTWNEATGMGIRAAKSDQDWDVALNEAEQYILTYAEAIRQGDFRPNAEDCAAYCPYHAVCRRDSTGGGSEDAVE